MGILDYIVGPVVEPVIDSVIEDKGKRVRGWCFTLHEYSDEELSKFENIEVKYIVYGKEICPTTQRKHLQGYMYFQDKVSMKWIKEKLGIKRIHLESANGTAEQNRKYCTKEGEYVERGERPQQGRRSDIAFVREIIKSGGNIRKLLEEDCVNYQTIKIAEKYLTYCESSRNYKPEVYWIYGSTGTGKSHLAYEMAGEDVYTCNKDNKWWDGYDGHECVVIDDMRGDFAKFHEILRLLDKYQYRAEVKGGFRQLLAKRIIITTTKHPRVMFKKSEEDIDQLVRRITWIYHKKIDVVRKYKVKMERVQDEDGDDIWKVSEELQE